MSDYIRPDEPLTPNKGCWSKFTPLEAGLCLILLVAIHFLVVMIVLYCVFALSPQFTSIDCKDFCEMSSRQGTDDVPLTDRHGPYRYLNDGGNVGNDNPIADEDQDESSSEKAPLFNRRVDPNLDKDCDKNSKNYHPFAAALNEQLYIDEKIEMFLKCIVGVLSPGWVLTSTACFEDLKPSTFHHSFIRMGSESWTKGGELIEIKNVMVPPGLLNSRLIPTMGVIKLKSPSKAEICVKAAKLPKFNSLENAKKGYVLTWHSNWSYPLRQRVKFGHLDLISVKIRPYAECPQPWGSGHDLYCATTGQNLGYCVFHSSGPIFSKDMALMGIQVKNYCDRKTKISYFYYENIYKNIGWLQDIGAVSKN